MLNKKDSPCQKNTRWKGCCCNCEKHYPYYGHPLVDGNSISTQIGWICNVFNSLILSRQHGFCEMYEKEKEN